MIAFFRSTTRLAGYIVAAFLIIYPMLLGVTYFLGPVINEHRVEIADWASKFIGMPVTIDRVSLSWYQLEPEVDLIGVTVLKKETSQPVLQIKKISVMFSVPRSLWHWQLVPGGLSVSGTDINITQNAAGEMAVQGFPSFGGSENQPFPEETKLADVVGWLSSQPRLILRDIDIHYTGFRGQKRFVTLYNLGFKNGGGEHDIFGKAVLHQEIPTDVKLSIRWEGDPADMKSIKAKAYLSVTGVSLPQWTDNMVLAGWQLKNGIGSAKIWLTWEDNALQAVQSRFQLYSLNLYSPAKKITQTINRLSGNVGWKREGQLQIYAGDDILIDLPKHLWPVNNFYVSLVPSEGGQLQPKMINIGYLDLSDVQAFISSSGVTLADNIKKILNSLQLKGSLQNVHLVFDGAMTDWQHILVETKLNRVSFMSVNGMPRITNLSGQLKWQASAGELTLNTNRGAIQYDSLFSRPISLEQLTGEVTWSKNEKMDWIFRLSNLELLNPDLSASVDAEFIVPQGGSVQADLTAAFSLHDARRVGNYLPVKTFDKSLVDWLQQAFLAGSVTSGKAVLKGSLNDFPFDHGNGTFTISGRVNNIDLRYAPDWPVLRQINADLVFAGRRMDVKLERARILDVPVAATHAEMTDIGSDKPQVVHVKSEKITTDFSRALRVVHESPLEKTIGKMLRDVDISGNADVVLDLTVPLDNPDSTNVLVDVETSNAQLNLVPWNLILTGLSGRFRLTENGMEAKSLQASLFNQPLQLQLTTVSKPDHSSFVQAAFATKISMNDLAWWLKMPLTSVASGATNINGQIDFSFKAPIVVRLDSQLVGIALDLPQPYGKNVKQARKFNAELTAEDKQPLRLKAVYADLLGAALLLDRKKDVFYLKGANLQLGAGVPQWPHGDGIYITGHFDKLNWDNIKTYIDQAGGTSLAGYTLRGIDMHVNELSLFGHQLTDAQIGVDIEDDYWNVNVSSVEAIGEVQVPRDFSSQSQMSAHFQTLYLKSEGRASQPVPVNLKSIPSLEVTANNFIYNGISLGRLLFKTSNNRNGISIDALGLTSPRLVLRSSGDVTQSKSLYTIRLEGSGQSDNVSELITGLGVDAHNFISKKGRLNFDLTWRDNAITPSLAAMSGNLSLDLGAGRIVEIGENTNAKMGIGRMLSIFSLQTIPRRLSLDFSDLFQKGYSFDTIRGDFSIKKGNAYTTNMRIDGPVAKVGINGRIGFKDQDYDFTLSVTPYVTSSLPLAATLIGGPVTGLAAVAVNTVIGSQLSKAIATYYYAVKGPWSNPSWDSIKAPASERR